MPGRAKPAGTRTTADRLRDEASRLFFEKGYAQTSMQDVAEAVDLLKGSLYHYIDSKEDLLYQILLEVRSGSLALMDAVAARDDLTPLERLREYVAANVEYNSANVFKGTIYYREFSYLSAEHQDRFARQTARYKAFVRALIDDAKDAGEIARHVDTVLVVNLVFTTINSVYGWYRPRGPVRPPEIGRLYAEMVLAGIAHTAAGSGAPSMSATP